MATEETLDPIAQDATANPEQSEETDGNAQPEETDYKALYEQEKSVRESAEKRYSDLRTDYDKQAEKSRKEKPAKKADPISEADIDWKIAHANEISLVREEYEAELREFEESGVPLTTKVREKALALARGKRGIADNAAEAHRQASVAGATTVVNRSSEPTITAEEEQAMKLWGFSKETLLEHKKRKEERGDK